MLLKRLYNFPGVCVHGVWRLRVASTLFGTTPRLAGLGTAGRIESLVGLSSFPPRCR